MASFCENIPALAAQELRARAEELKTCQSYSELTLYQVGGEILDRIAPYICGQWRQYMIESNLIVPLSP